MTFGADIIAGFPTETEPMFLNSLNLVSECSLTWLHVFPYSPRRGTPAAKMPQVSGTAIRERAARLREAGAAAIAAHLTSCVGKTSQVLMEAPRMGRTETFAEVHFCSDQTEGAIVPTRLTGTRGRSLSGDVV
jgi:threonylcarbamoyladenosine tRNA methylthiotransferase MtaB